MLEPRLHCPHNCEDQATGLAIISLGNDNSVKQNVTSALIDQLAPALLRDVCLFDQPCQSKNLAQCLLGHQAAIVIDAGNPKANDKRCFLLLDIGAVLERKEAHVQPHDDLVKTIAEELRPAMSAANFPKRIIFFRFCEEENDGSACSRVTPMMKVATQCASKIIETLKQNLCTVGTNNHSKLASRERTVQKN